MPSRFVRPDTVILPISEGDTITVKRRLTSGEQRAMYSRMYRAGVDGKTRVDVAQSGLAIVLAYLVDWTLVDDDGIRVAILREPIEAVESALNNLDSESFTEIKDAIEAHEGREDTARAEEKKLRGSAESGRTIS